MKKRFPKSQKKRRAGKLNMFIFLLGLIHCTLYEKVRPRLDMEIPVCGHLISWTGKGVSSV